MDPTDSADEPVRSVMAFSLYFSLLILQLVQDEYF